MKEKTCGTEWEALIRAKKVGDGVKLMSCKVSKAPVSPLFLWLFLPGLDHAAHVEAMITPWEKIYLEHS